MKTLLLDTNRWDLCLTVEGNIAVASDPYSVAQDVASAVRLFLGELWFDTTKGIPYLQSILGYAPPLAYIKSKIVDAALTVPGVLTATCFITAFQDREIKGQVQVTIATPPTVTVSPPNPAAIPIPPTPTTYTLSFVGDGGGMLVFVNASGGVVQFTGGA